MNADERGFFLICVICVNLRAILRFLPTYPFFQVAHSRNG
jgi:hypothetical protein